MSPRSATGVVQLQVEADRTEIDADDSDLSFIMISLVDEKGYLYNTADRKVSLQVERAGVLQRYGSANPRSEESFFVRYIRYSTGRY